MRSRPGQDRRRNLALGSGPILDDKREISVDDIEDTVGSLAQMGIELVNGLTQEEEEQQEDDLLRSMREWGGPGPQLTGEAWRMLIRAAEREKVAFQRSKQAAIAKHGAVLVNAAERWARPRHPEVSYTYLAGVDPYEFFVRMYRGAYRRAMWDAGRRRRPQEETTPQISWQEGRRTLRAIKRVQAAPSRPFVGAYPLEARRD